MSEGRCTWLKGSNYSSGVALGWGGEVVSHSRSWNFGKGLTGFRLGRDWVDSEDRKMATHFLGGFTSGRVETGLGSDNTPAQRVS